MNAWYITLKDLLLLVRDRRAAVTLLLLPLIFIFIIGVSTGQLLSGGEDDRVIELAVVTECDCQDVTPPQQVTEEQFTDEELRAMGFDPSTDKPEFDANAQQLDLAPTEAEIALDRKNCHQLIRELISRLNERDGIRVTEVDAAGAQELITGAKRHVIVTIGPEFFQRIISTKTSELIDSNSKAWSGLERFDIKISSRSAQSNTEATVAGLVTMDLFGTIGPYIACRNSKLSASMGATCDQYTMEGTTPERSKENVEQRSVNKHVTTVYQELVPQYTVLFVFFLISIMARSFLHERELGTLRRLRIAPVKPASLLAGKTVPFLIISFVQTLLLFLCGRLLFGMSWGPRPALLLPVMFCTSLAATGLGLLVATIVRTDSQVSAYGNIIVLTMAGMAGCFIPRDWMPATMQRISLVTPHAWSLKAYGELLMMTEPNVSFVFYYCLMLVAFSALFFTIGATRVNHLT